MTSVKALPVFILLLNLVSMVLLHAGAVIHVCVSDRKRLKRAPVERGIGLVLARGRSIEQLICYHLLFAVNWLFLLCGLTKAPAVCFFRARVNSRLDVEFVLGVLAHSHVLWAVNLRRVLFL